MSTQAARTLLATLTKLVESSRAAECEAYLWADEVRQRAEARLGVGPTDERAWSDSEYGAALDSTGRVHELRIAAERATASVEALIAQDGPAKTTGGIQ